jgi:hypothetical protein
VDRLTKHIGALKAEIEEEANAEAVRLRDERNQANEELAKRLQEDLKPAIETFLRALHDLATAAQEDAKVNARLPAGVQRVTSADVIGRAIPMQPREEIAEEIVELWVNAQSGQIVGDQGAVVRMSADVGTVGPWRTRCARRKYRMIDYLEETPVQRAPSFLSALRIPACDGPGFAWPGGDEFVHPAKVLQFLAQRDKASAVAQRQTLKQFVPFEPWAPPPEVEHELKPVGRRKGTQSKPEDDAQ